MKISLLKVGATHTDYIVAGIKMYLDRLKYYIPVEIIELPDIKNTKSLSKDQQKEKEGALILASVQNSDRVILLDERGKEFTSREFSTMLEREMSSGIRRLVFVVGGPYGFAEEVYKRADSKVSFSKMTFSHEMIRLFFVEQVYRAMTILRNEPYHHD